MTTQRQGYEHRMRSGQPRCQRAVHLGHCFLAYGRGEYAFSCEIPQGRVMVIEPYRLRHGTSGEKAAVFIGSQCTDACHITVRLCQCVGRAREHSDRLAAGEPSVVESRPQGEGQVVAMRAERQRTRPGGIHRLRHTLISVPYFTSSIPSMGSTHAGTVARCMSSKPCDSSTLSNCPRW